MRQIKCKWRRYQDIERVFRWLNLDSTWDGRLFNKHTKKLVGYKFSDDKHLIFNFT